jgi:hypothetical protein
MVLSSQAAQKNTYLEDLDFIHEVILGNHPGVYNEEDPQFNTNLSKFYYTAREKMMQVSSIIEERQVINEFCDKFQDSHLWVNWRDSQPKDSLYKKVEKFSISYLSKDVVWLKIPTFDLSKDQQGDFTKLLEKLPNLACRQYIIFDLRGNQGGNSEYGSKLLGALFGKELTEQKICKANEHVYVDWRASEGNLQHISDLLLRYSNNWLLQIERGLKSSIAQNKKYYREMIYDSCNLKNFSEMNSPVKAKIIVIIDSSNVSAALDFIDELKIMDDSVLLVGQKTKADRLYIEVRSMPLPSGDGSFSFPIKVYRNRPRLDNEAYIPDIEYKNITDTAALQKFVLGKIIFEDRHSHL